VTPPRFERMGDLWAIHYPRGYTIAETPLAALQQALRIQRWRLANERVVASWDARPVVDTGRPREAVAGDLLAWALGVIEGETK
jgi:hypothetical protein